MTIAVDHLPSIAAIAGPSSLAGDQIGRLLGRSPFEEGPACAAPRPGVCRSVETLDRGRTWTMEAEDADDALAVAEALRRVARPDTGLSWLLADLEQVRRDGRHIRIELRRPLAHLPALLASPLLRVVPARSSTVSTFRIAGTADAGRALVLDRVGEARDGALARIVLLPGLPPEQARRLMDSGHLDFCAPLPGSLAGEVEFSGAIVRPTTTHLALSITRSGSHRIPAGTRDRLAADLDRSELARGIGRPLPSRASLWRGGTPPGESPRSPACWRAGGRGPTTPIRLEHPDDAGAKLVSTRLAEMLRALLGIPVKPQCLHRGDVAEGLYSTAADLRLEWVTPLFPDLAALLTPLLMRAEPRRRLCGEGLDPTRELRAAAALLDPAARLSRLAELEAAATPVLAQIPLVAADALIAAGGRWSGPPSQGRGVIAFDEARALARPEVAHAS